MAMFNFPLCEITPRWSDLEATLSLSHTNLGCTKVNVIELSLSTDEGETSYEHIRLTLDDLYILHAAIHEGIERLRPKA